MSKEAGGTQSVERAFGLLRAFTDGQPEMRVSDLARESGLGQSTVSRLLATLEALGYVVRDEQRGLYRLGHELVALAGVALNQSPVFREARQIAQDLACSLGLGANVAERRGDRLFYLFDFEGRLAPRSFTLMGRSGPLYSTGLGKALICGLPAEEVDALLPEEDLLAFTPHTITDRQALHEELAEVRRRGYSREVEELAFGRGCVAAPIRDRAARTVAALSISGPLSALDLGAREGELASTVIETADQISINLGYVASASLAKDRR